MAAPLDSGFFDRGSRVVARALLGKVLRRRYRGQWLAARIIETEAYQRSEKGSHASLGRTPSREALFMPAGTIYMYYARGADSLNVSCRGAGDAVLIKSGHPFFDDMSPARTLRTMQRLNPGRGGEARPVGKLMKGQTLVCRALDLRVPDWTTRGFDVERFFVDDVHDAPSTIIEARRLGIPAGRDEHLMWRFVDSRYVTVCTSNPLTKRAHRAGRDYRVVSRDDS